MTIQNIYEEQGFVLLQATSHNEAKYLIKKITNTKQKFSYADFGLINQRVEEGKSDPAKAGVLKLFERC